MENGHYPAPPDDDIAERAALIVASVALGGVKREADPTITDPGAAGMVALNHVLLALQR